jgi:hypothetical protein
MAKRSFITPIGLSFMIAILSCVSACTVVSGSSHDPSSRQMDTANAPTQLETIIEFPAGKNVVVLPGKLEKPGSHRKYTVQVNKDQVLYVQLSSPSNLIGFEVFDPSGKSIGTAADEDWEWEDVASETGTYRIDVSAVQKGVGNYKLKVMLKKER